MATNEPFRPLAALLVTIVYSSPSDSEIKSMLKYGPAFSRYKAILPHDRVGPNLVITDMVFILLLKLLTIQVEVFT